MFFPQKRFISIFISFSSTSNLRKFNIDANFEDEKLQTDITLFEKQENGLFSKEQDSIIQEYHSKEFLTKLLKECNFEIQEIKEFNLHTDEESDKLIFICKKVA